VNSAHVCWLQGLSSAKVYHRMELRLRKVKDAAGEYRIDVLRVPCGVVVSCRLFRAQEGTEHEARRLGLRPCQRCWRRRTDAGSPSEAP